MKNFTAKSFVVRYRFWIFAAACALPLCYPAGENLFNWACITNGMNPDWRKVYAEILQWIGLCSAGLFPIAAGITFRHWRFSEKWLLLILACALFDIPLTFGLRNPYVDYPLCDQPMLAYLMGTATWFLVGAVLLGPVLIGAHFVWRSKRRPPAPLWRRILCPTAALLLSAALLTAYWKILDITC